MAHTAALLLATCAAISLAACGREPVPGLDPLACTPPCVAGDAQPSPSPVPPGTHGDSGRWMCTTAASGETSCTADGRLPPGGSNWSCREQVDRASSSPGRWVCHGESPADPSGKDWSCEAVNLAATIWRCQRASATDMPPGAWSFDCTMSSARGLVCVRQPTGRDPSQCLPGERQWCEDPQTGSWGQVACDPATGRWETMVKDGAPIPSCRVMVNGERPDTICACYHLFVDVACCERLDCIVTPGTSGRRCAPSAGGLCDPCNPMKTECQGSEARCIITNAHESFCGRRCAATEPCPAGYTCTTVKGQGGASTQQCVPTDLSCLN